MINAEIKPKKYSFSKEFESEYHNNYLKVSNSSIIIGEKGLITTNDLPSGIVLLYFRAVCTKQRTRTSIQVSKSHHIEAGKFASNVNHSCSPNCRVRTSFNHETQEGVVAFFSIRNIKNGEEITFDYASTEIELTPELDKKLCKCDTINCRGYIYPYSKLPYLFKEKLENENVLAEHIVELIS